MLKNAPRVQPCAKSGQTYFNRKHIKNQYLVSGHPTGASGIEFHYKGPDISYLLNTEEERKLIRILGLKRKMGLGFSPMVLCVVQRLCALTFFRPYRTLHLLLISKAEISHEHCERTVVFLEPLSFCQQREVTKSLQLKSRCV